MVKHLAQQPFARQKTAAPIWNLDHHLEEADGDATASDHRIAIDSRHFCRLHFTSQSLQGRRDGSHRCHPNDRQGDDSDTRIGTRRPLRANRHRERCAPPHCRSPWICIRLFWFGLPVEVKTSVFFARPRVRFGLARALHEPPTSGGYVASHAAKTHPPRPRLMRFTSQA